MFKLPISEYEKLTELMTRFDPYNKMWDLCNDFTMDSKRWYTDPFT